MVNFQEALKTYLESVNWVNDQAKLQTKAVCEDMFNQLASKVERSDEYKRENEYLKNVNIDLLNTLSKLDSGRNSTFYSKGMVKYLKGAL